MKQTAVQWLFDNLNITGGSDDMKAFEQAKAMEKERMIEFGKIVADKWGMVPVPLENIEDTYNETFKSE